MQYVKIDLSGRAYTYAWAGEQPLAVGDWVVVPGNSYNPDPSTGRVLRLLKTCDFTGKVTILRQKIDVRKPQQADGVKGQVSPSAAVDEDRFLKEHGMTREEEYGWNDYGYSDNVLGRESGPIDNYMDTQYRGDTF
jgi:hypothetical protein